MFSGALEDGRVSFDKYFAHCLQTWSEIESVFVLGEGVNKEYAMMAWASMSMMSLWKHVHSQMTQSWIGASWILDKYSSIARFAFLCSLIVSCFFYLFFLISFFKVSKEVLFLLRWIEELFLESIVPVLLEHVDSWSSIYPLSYVPMFDCSISCETIGLEICSWINGL